MAPITNEHNDKLAAAARERRQYIAAQINAGRTRREISELLGISKQRLGVLIRQAEKEGLL